MNHWHRQRRLHTLFPRHVVASCQQLLLPRLAIIKLIIPSEFSHLVLHITFWWQQHLLYHHKITDGQGTKNLHSPILLLLRAFQDFKKRQWESPPHLVYGAQDDGHDNFSGRNGMPFERDNRVDDEENCHLD